MASPITVSEMIDQVRKGADETNTATVDDDLIVSLLNRAQDYAADILVRHYPEPLLTFTSVPLVQGQKEYDMPEGVFEERIEKLEVYDGFRYYDLIRLSYRDVTDVEGTMKAARPYNYALFSRKLYILPPPTGDYPIRVWYIKEPEKLVKDRGQVYSVGGMTLTLNGFDKAFFDGTSATSYERYVHIVDKDTGVVKATMQASSWTASSITFTATPAKSTVFNTTVDTAIPSTVQDGDYICVAGGICVPYLKKPFTNFAIQFAIAEIRHQFSENPELEQRMLKLFEEQVERTWVKRENQLRVKNRNRRWLTRRFWR